MGATYTVTARAVYATVGHQVRIVESGSPLPEGVPVEDIERLLGKGMITANQPEDAPSSEPVKRSPKK